MQTERALIADHEAHVRVAEPSDDERVIALLTRHVTAGDARRRYDWIYRRNPQGPARMWLAVDPVSDEILGFTSIFARDYAVQGLVVAGGVGFDAFVPPRHRRRGLALRMHQHAHAAMLRGDVPYRFIAGTPTPANVRQLVRAGGRVIGGLRYLGLPLDARGAELLFRHGHADDTRHLTGGWMIDRLLSATRRLLLGGSGALTARPLTTVDGSSFDNLWLRLAAQLAVVGRRDAAVLRWRYLENPVAPQELIAIELGRQLVGWAAVELSSRGALVVDHLLPLDGTLLRRAVAALVAHLAERRVGRIMIRCNLDGPYARPLLRLGFLPGRHSNPFVLMGGSELFQPSTAGWHFTAGDMNPETMPWRVNSTPADAEAPLAEVIQFVDDGANRRLPDSESGGATASRG